MTLDPNFPQGRGRGIHLLIISIKGNFQELQVVGIVGHKVNCAHAKLRYQLQGGSQNLGPKKSTFRVALILKPYNM